MRAAASRQSATQEPISALSPSAHPSRRRLPITGKASCPTYRLSALAPDWISSLEHRCVHPIGCSVGVWNGYGAPPAIRDGSSTATCCAWLLYLAFLRVQHSFRGGVEIAHGRRWTRLLPTVRVGGCAARSRGSQCGALS